VGTTARILRIAAVLLALAALLLLAASGPSVRFDLLGYRWGLTLFGWSFYAGLAAAVLAVVALAWPLARARGIAAPLACLIVGLAVAYVPFQFRQAARAVPPINDITTDVENPPQYMTGRKPYPGAEVARQQRAAYPDIVPSVVQMPKAQAFARAMSVAESMGWEVVGRDGAAGTIEAVDTTKWFGFKDDIAVRLTPAGEGRTRIDVRSKSRVGRGDVGTNAERIRAYLQRLK
jgi:uncharacterized protein (DUF1499 family)